jgi:3-hydroxybutyryl-CoA dehydrogenase
MNLRKKREGYVLMKIKKIGIIGAGQMGNGIGHVAAQNGYDVLLLDVSEDALQKAIATIDKNLERMVKKEKISAEDKEKTLANIATTTEMSDLKDCDFIIEAATEREVIKEKIFAELQNVAKPDAILASNTSSLSITRLAGYSGRPEQFIGMHFMNPVPIMKLVEVICGIATSEETFQAVDELAKNLGKVTAVSQDYPGFIVNRILIPMLNEAVCTLMSGVGDVESIDAALTFGAGFPMGPLTLADFIGLDTCLAIMQVLHNELGEDKYRPSPLLIKYVEAGWLGRKSGKGFYDYSGDKPVPTR